MWELLNNKFSIGLICLVIGLGIGKFSQPSKVVEIEKSKTTETAESKDTEKKEKIVTHKVIPQAGGLAPIIEDTTEDVTENISEKFKQTVAELEKMKLTENSKPSWALIAGAEIGFKDMETSYYGGGGHRWAGPLWQDLTVNPKQQRLQTDLRWEF